MRNFLVLIAVALVVNAWALSPREAKARGAKFTGMSAAPPAALAQVNKVQTGMCEYVGTIGSCTVCTNLLGKGSCGWCGATQECMEGTANGPAYGKCASEWAYQPAKCKDCLSPVVSGLTLDNFVMYNGEYHYAGVSQLFSYYVKGNATTGFQYLFFDAYYRVWNIGPALNDLSLVDIEATQQIADPSRVTQTWMAWNYTSSEYQADPTIKVTCAEKGWEDPCAQFSECDACTLGIGLYTKCGWCQSTNKCVSASQGAGPLVGKCDVWNSFPFQCPGVGVAYSAYCASQPNCSTCTSAGLCIWCDATQTCMTGTKKGPATGTCPYWTYPGAVCPGEYSKLTDCVSCLGLDQSVWCHSTQTCMPGSYGGPATGYSCPDWSYYIAYCPEKNATCTQHTTCDECNQDFHCGWCQTSKKCLIAGGKGPWNATCKDWRPVRSYCSAKPKKVVPNCLTIGPENCPAKDFNMLAAGTVCGKTKCTKTECCSNTCSSFSKSKCPKYTTRTANLKSACETYTCTATECCIGKCSLLKNPCGSGMTFNKTRVCSGRRCLKEDCCQTTCKSFNATLCDPETTKFVTNPAEVKCQLSVCNPTECCLPA